MQPETASKDKQAVNALYDDNRFYILGEFDDQLKEKIIVPLTRKISELSNQRSATIEVYINSPGGQCDIMWHVVNLIELAKAKGITVRTIVMGEAYSAASMTAITGTVGERYIDRYAEHLPHFGTAYGWPKHTPLQLERETAHLQRHFQHLVDHYQKYCKIPKLEQHIKDDNFFITAKQAIDWGMADKYVEEL